MVVVEFVPVLVPVLVPVPVVDVAAVVELPPWAWTSMAWISAESCWNGLVAPVADVMAAEKSVAEKVRLDQSEAELACAVLAASADEVESPPQAAAAPDDCMNDVIQESEAILLMDTIPGSCGWGAAVVCFAAPCRAGLLGSGCRGLRNPHASGEPAGLRRKRPEMPGKPCPAAAMRRQILPGAGSVSRF